MYEGKRLSIGIIGAGGIANKIHLPALREIDSIDIVAICDIVKEKADNLAEKFVIPRVYTLYNEMIEKEKLDAVYVLVQPDQLFRITFDCLRSGLHVFCEKPPGITTFQAETLLRISKDAGKILQIGFNRRYIPLVQHVVGIMQKTTKITQVEGCFFKHGSAAFYNGCASAFECDTIHSIDLLQWIAGGKPVVAATVKGQENSDVINSWNSVIRFDNGVTAILKANYQTGGRVHKFEIHGPEASAYINIGFGEPACEADIIYFSGKGTQSMSSKGPGKQKIVHIDGMELAGSNEYHRYYGYYQENVEFIESIRSNKKPLADISEAIKTMHLVDLLNNSSI